MKTARIEFVLKTVLVLAVLLVGGIGTTYAAAPKLSEITGQELQDLYQTGRTYTIRLRYSDADGDRPRSAQFIDESPTAGRIPKNAKVETVDDQNFDLIWEIRGLEQGPHHAYFIAQDTEGNAVRYPADTGQFYDFRVEAPATRWIIMGVGLIVGLLFLPFLVYVLARSLNRRGDPSKAARVGLLFGILASAALFIYLFTATYGPIAYAIGGIAALALLVLVLTRR